jgi:SAM-dependent methyltransferase
MLSKFHGIFSPYGKISFIKRYIPNKGKVLDVGCGNNSPFRTKSLRPDIRYVGLDVGMCNQIADPSIYADELIITSPEDFASRIAKYTDEFDAVISAHNLEHCNDYEGVLFNMLKSVNGGGYLYLSFPCEDSVNFPSRKGTLNFYDDKTHRNIIRYKSVADTIKNSGFDIVFGRRNYKPFLLYLIGLLCEPVSILLKKVIPCSATWAFYGFETVIIAKKHQSN